MPTMFVLARTSEHSRVRKAYVTVPWVTALVEPDPDEPARRYYVLEDEPEPAPEPPKAPRRHGPKPRRGGKEIIPLLDE